MILNNPIHKKYLELWLKTSIILIFFMILVGGLTRLTDSGLSITEWELFSGILPPSIMSNGTNIFYCIKIQRNLLFLIHL